MKMNDFLQLFGCIPFFGCSIYCLIVSLAMTGSASAFFCHICLNFFFIVFIFTFTAMCIFTVPLAIFIPPFIGPLYIAALFFLLLGFTCCSSAICGFFVTHQMRIMKTNVSKMRRMRIDELTSITFPFWEIRDLSTEMNSLVDTLIEIRPLLPDNLFDEDEDEGNVEETTGEDDGDETKNRKKKKKRKSGAEPNSDYEIKMYGYSGSKYGKFGKSTHSITSNSSIPESPLSELSSGSLYDSHSSLSRESTGASGGFENSPLSPSINSPGSSFFSRIRRLSVASLGRKESNTSTISSGSDEGHDGRVYDRERNLNLHLRPHLLTIVCLRIANMNRLIESQSLHSVLEIYEQVFECVKTCTKKNRGSILEFSLDTITMFFGGRKNNRLTHGVLGCLAALDIQVGMETINGTVPGEAIQYAIGMGQGEGLIGLIGSKQKMRLSCYGQLMTFSLFLANQRLYRFTDRSSKVLISESVLASLPDLEFSTIPVDIIMHQKERKDVFLLLKRNKLLKKDQEWMYELEEQKQAKKFELFHKGFQNMLGNDFEGAMNIFQQQQYENNYFARRFCEILKRAISTGSDFETLYGEGVGRILEYESSTDFFSLFPDVKVNVIRSIQSEDPLGNTRDGTEEEEEESEGEEEIAVYKVDVMRNISDDDDDEVNTSSSGSEMRKIEMKKYVVVGDIDDDDDDDDGVIQPTNDVNFDENEDELLEE